MGCYLRVVYDDKSKRQEKSEFYCFPLLLILYQGGSKIQEAHLIFQDLSEKYPATCLILNGKALCLMHMGNFEDAEGLLLESLNKVSSNDVFRSKVLMMLTCPSEHLL